MPSHRRTFLQFVSSLPLLSRAVAAPAGRRLREGSPSIELVPGPYERDTLEVAAWTLEPGEAEIVGRRIREVLRSA